jgi:NADPH-dependent 2,4-dienoyl-CoA reductase/sulfur reductase-like enzyme
VTAQPTRVLVVGASAAGLATATALRRKGYAGRITVLGAEPHAPYDRPPLSKQHLAGEWHHDRLRLAPPDVLSGLDLDLRTGTAAVSLDLSSRLVRDEHGGVHAFDHLVVATGLRPRRLGTLADVDPLVLRTMEDGVRLRDAVTAGSRVLVVGAGFLGLEAAATLNTLGARVLLLDPVASPLADRIGASTAQLLLDLHRARGVEIRTGVTVATATRTAAGIEISDSGRGTYTVDLVLESVGSVPSTEWLEGSGLELGDGVVCDERSSAADGIWAAGDVARWYHVGYGRSMRIEHRTNATDHGQHVAGAILGDPSPYTPLPFFWTDHYDARIQLAGRIPPNGEETLVPVEGRPASHLRLFHEHGELVGVLGWNAPREIGRYRRELAAAVGRPVQTA